jgi:hypothetical protein
MVGAREQFGTNRLYRLKQFLDSCPGILHIIDIPQTSLPEPFTSKVTNDKA